MIASIPKVIKRANISLPIYCNWL